MIGKNFKIDKNIPVPYNSSQSTIVTTARAMEVGDSVLVDDRNHLSNLRAKIKQTGFDAVSRTIYEDGKVIGYRIWKIKKRGEDNE
jgi:hypothetical protein